MPGAIDSTLTCISCHRRGSHANVVGCHAKAQAYFDQGIRWAFAFNHAEAHWRPARRRRIVH